jgi:hypothetical protein
VCARNEEKAHALCVSVSFCACQGGVPVAITVVRTRSTLKKHFENICISMLCGNHEKRTPMCVHDIRAKFTAIKLIG